MVIIVTYYQYDGFLFESSLVSKGVTTVLSPPPPPPPPLNEAAPSTGELVELRLLRWLRIACDVVPEFPPHYFSSLLTEDEGTTSAHFR